MAQCKAELVEEDAIWYCTREKGHGGDHQDSRGNWWADPEHIKQVQEKLHQEVEALLDEAEADRQQEGEG